MNLWKNFMIKILKLVTGEEIIGDASGESVVVLDKPCALQLIPSRANPEQPMMALIPYASYSKEHKILIPEDKIVWSAEPIEELYNQYNSIFGSGIVVAKQSSFLN